MIKLNKKLYYKYYDIWKLSVFCRDKSVEKYSKNAMDLILRFYQFNLLSLSESKLLSLGFSHDIVSDIEEYHRTNSIHLVDEYKSRVEEWIQYLILPDFFDPHYIAELIRENHISSREQLYNYFRSKDSLDTLGCELADLYAYFTSRTGSPGFPILYSRSYKYGNDIQKILTNSKIIGNFHNHTTYSDGKCSIKELSQMAFKAGRKYIGISDHTKELRGVTEHDVVLQHQEINKENRLSPCRILKSVECEILIDGSLDLNSNILGLMDYVIIAVHSNTKMIKLEAEKRLLKAIENPHANILAHPSARLYKRKVELYVDMHKIIDACVENKVAIEINGDPSRIDLDPSYIQYAIDKGAYFTLDSDTHSKNGFLNINNSIQIANDYNIPPECCLNTFSLSELNAFFAKY